MNCDYLLKNMNNNLKILNYFNIREENQTRMQEDIHTFIALHLLQAEGKAARGSTDDIPIHTISTAPLPFLLNKVFHGPIIITTFSNIKFGKLIFKTKEDLKNS